MHILHNVSLQPYNTFHFDCVAASFVEITNTQDFQDLLQTDIFQNNPRLILGGGSNILLTQDTFLGLVIKNNILGKEVMSEDTTSITLKVGAGENWNDFVRRSIDQGWYGIENLVSIPGTVGAAPMQNIGAYGGEAKSVIKEVHYISLEDGKEYSLNKNQCAFGYRSSVFKTELKNKVFITYVTITLSKYNPKTYNPNISYNAITNKLAEQAPLSSKRGVGGELSPKLLATAITSIRSSKLPDWTKIGTAGSFFKNPVISEETYLQLKESYPTLKGFPTDVPPEKGVSLPEGSEGELGGFIKLSAGQLIDLSGLKGITQGPVGTYKKHALVLVHHGGGTGKDIVELAKYIQKSVYEKFTLIIEPEVNYV